MASGMEVASRRVRVAALLLIAGLAAGPIGTHVYWMLGGTWGLGGEGNSTATGVRVVAAVVVLLLVAAVLGRAGAGRVVAAGDRVRSRDSILRLGAGGGLPGRDAGGLHLE